MEPDLEVVQIQRGESFKAWSHGYPYRTVRWHFHPEYELHHVVATGGKYFVGDFIGNFEPGNLVLTGPNLPHNWVSEMPPGAIVPLRCRIVQFSQEFIGNAMVALPELVELGRVLERSRHGVLFAPEIASSVGPLLEELVEAQGARRIALFMHVMASLCKAGEIRTLASSSYLPDPSGYMSAGMNKVLAFIAENLNRPFSEGDLAGIAGQSAGGFSRSFRKHTGMSLVQYVNRLRINVACQLLMSEPDSTITDICYTSGFNNVSNFNRQFLAQKGMAPSRFRALLERNTRAAEAA
jgi:AraC-like DNA-binding protein